MKVKAAVLFSVFPPVASSSKRKRRPIKTIVRSGLDTWVLANYTMINMRQTSKFLVSLTTLAVIVVTQSTLPADSQMVYGPIFAKSAQLTGWNSMFPKRNAPILKASSLRDLLIDSVPLIENALEPLSLDATVGLVNSRSGVAITSALVESIEQLLSSPVPLVRAPPLDIQLLDA